MIATEWLVLFDALAHRAAHQPDQLAYDDGTQTLTYGELLARAAERAAAMRAQGVRRGDRVALVMSAGVPFAEAFWGAQAIGAVPCAFNPSERPAAIERRIARLRAALVITDDTVGALAVAGAEHEAAGTTTDDPAYFQQTSGTSGEPRAAILLHRNVLRSCRAHVLSQGTEEDDVIVAWVPPWHDLGLVHYVIGAVMYGAPCHIIQPAIRTIPAWLAKITEVGGTVSAAPDFAFRLAARMVDPAAVDLSSVRYFTNGGEPVRASTIAEFERAFAVPGVVVPGYGLAEATLGVTSHTVGEPLAVDARGNVACGRPMPGLEVRAGHGLDGAADILVRGEAVFPGYFEAAEDTAAALRGSWLHTGDTGYFDDEGRLFVLGRRRALIKRGGAVVAPRELEEAAQGADGVQLAAAVGVPGGADGGEVVTLVVEVAQKAGRDGGQVAAEVTRLVVAAAGFAPGRVVVVPPRTVPRTANGKIRHEALRTAVAAGAIV